MVWRNNSRVLLLDRSRVHLASIVQQTFHSIQSLSCLLSTLLGGYKSITNLYCYYYSQNKILIVGKEMHKYTLEHPLGFFIVTCKHYSQGQDSGSLAKKLMLRWCPWYQRPNATGLASHTILSPEFWKWHGAHESPSIWLAMVTVQLSGSWFLLSFQSAIIWLMMYFNECNKVWLVYTCQWCPCATLKKHKD